MNTISQHTKKKKQENYKHLSYFSGKYFFNDKSQNYLLFQPVLEYLQTTSTTISNYRALDWRPKGLSNEIIKPLTITNNCLASYINFYNNYKIRLTFDGSCIKQEKYLSLLKML